MIEQVSRGDSLFAIIVHSSYTSKGIEFFTPSTFSQQLGYMNREKGYSIPPHIHMPVYGVEYTKEVLFVKSGRLRVDFYETDKSYFTSRILCGGDVILLAYGGHGFCMLEDTEIIEVKQGPYAGDQDKLRFEQPEDFHPSFKL